MRGFAAILIIQVPPDLIQASGPLSRPNATDFFTFLNEQVSVNKGKAKGSGIKG